MWNKENELRRKIAEVELQIEKANVRGDGEQLRSLQFAIKSLWERLWKASYFSAKDYGNNRHHSGKGS